MVVVVSELRKRSTRLVDVPRSVEETFSLELNLPIGQKFYSAILACLYQKYLYQYRILHSLITCECNFASGLISLLCNFPEVFESKF